MMFILNLFQFLSIFSLFLKNSQGYDICNSQVNCENCINVNFDCAWCIDKDFSLKTRCLTESKLLEAGCNASKIVKNTPKIVVLQNQDLQDFRPNTPYAQLKPQKIKVKLTKSRTERFRMTYRPAENNPLDLYFLMDLTWSMKDDKETLVNIGEQLTIQLEKLTKNFRFGFGSFADKPIMPIISPTTKLNPCKIVQDKCEPTYSYHHHLPLTKNIKDFINKVNASKITANLDNLEGGFDALMQVIVCNNEIGWNDDARKIVILATDGLMHFAGDGLLAGIVRKNDKKCHLKKLNNNSYWEYVDTLEYDYPSLEEIYRELLKRKINVIFAVTKDVEQPYRQMWNLMKNVSGVEILKNDSSNIVELIKKGYENIVKKVQFEDNSPSIFQITYETDCGGTHDMKTTNYCDDAQIGKEIDFYINITLTDFPEDNNYDYVIRIEETRLSEFLELEVEIQKPCPCKENNFEASEYTSRRGLCKNHGLFSCGICKCDHGWIGLDCSCDLQNYTSISAMEVQCRKPSGDQNSEKLGSVCSNQGECECGECFCYKGYTGKYCECRTCLDCNPENSECVCGECKCKPGWTGEQCDCPDTVEHCIAPNGEKCLNHGKCKCNMCECDESYYGKFCEINISHGNKLCPYYEPCVRCLIEERQGTNKCNNLDEVCSGNGISTNFNYTFTEEYFDSHENYCLIRLLNKDDIKCDHYYKYDIDVDGKSYIKIRMQICETLTQKTQFWGPIIFVLTIVIGAIIIIICRCIVYIRDKREYAIFEKQIQQQSFEMDSPIYKSPITHYHVPKRDED